MIKKECEKDCAARMQVEKGSCMTEIGECIVEPKCNVKTE